LADAYRCVGIDPAADAIRWAQQRFPEVRFICGRAPHALGSASRDAQLYLIADVLEHVADDFQLLSSLLEHAAPGAHVLVTVPADLSLWSRHDETNGHYRRYDPARLQRLWRDLPVDELLVSHFNARLEPVIRAVRWMNRRRGRASGEAGLDARMPARWTNAMLRRIFTGERRRLVDALGGQRPGYRSGVSLVALLRKRDEAVRTITRPPDVEPDFFDPTAGRYLRSAA
jgi:hypothetical protein